MIRTRFSMLLRLLKKTHVAPILFLMGTFGVFFLQVIPQLLVEQPDGVYVAYEHLWSDWPLHIAIANRFATTSPSSWFSSHPMFAGGKFTYPFVSDFISGMLMRMGFSLSSAFVLPTMAYMIVLTAGLYFLWFFVFKKPWISVLSIGIFYLSSGMRFLYLVFEVLATKDIYKLFSQSVFYTRLDEYSWYSGNVIVGLLFPQRAFLLGMTIGVWIIASLIFAYDLKKHHLYRARFLLATIGFLSGVLPIVHMHSFIAIVVITGIISLVGYRNWQFACWFVFPATITSSVLVGLLLYGGIKNPEFMHVLIGWSATGGIVGWISMWIQLWGIALPLAILSFVGIRKITNKSLFVGFFLLFVLGNIILFQPVRWDNSKIFFWSYVGVSALCANFLYRLWKTKSYAHRVFSVLLLIFLTGTGFFDLQRITHVQENRLQIGSQEDISLGKKIQRETDENAYFLTGTSTNHLAMTWGARSILLGFTPWVANFGFYPDPRYEDMRQMYKGNSNAADLFAAYNVDYVVIGPGEQYEFSPDEDYFIQRYPLVFSSQNTRIYAVTPFKSTSY